MEKEYKTVFVFQRPLSKTNLQRSELISLIELQCKEASFDIFEFDELIKNTPRQEKDAYKKLLNYEHRILYREPLLKMVGILFFEQSAIVYTNFELDLIEMIRRSGYIHSVGNLLFVSKWEDINENAIINILQNFCCDEGYSFPFHFYTKSDNENQYDKLEKLLIDDKRYHIGKSSFNIAKCKIESTFNKYLIENGITRVGNGDIFVYKDSDTIDQKGKLNELYFDRNLIDFSICYLSRYKKDNPIHKIDESREAKPYWAGIFTTPHRLMNTMLNLAKVRENHTVVDPFCHTGTVAIESSQIGCHVILADIAEVQGAQDNFDFLCSGADKILENLGQLCNIATDKRRPHHADYNTLASESINLNNQGLPEIDDNKHIDLIVLS